MSPSQLARSALDLLTAPFGVEVVRRARQNWSDTRNFINYEDTISAAKKAGVPVGDYIDEVMSKDSRRHAGHDRGNGQARSILAADIDRG